MHFRLKMNTVSLMKAFLFIALYFASTSSQAAAYDKIIVFGDSLSDNGNISMTTDHQVPRNPPYFTGHFSNGEVWVEHVAEALGIDIDSPDQFVDQAFAGAYASDENAKEDTYALFNLPFQVDDYLTDRDKKLPNEKLDNHLFVIWIGSNDYLGGGQNLDPKIAIKNTISSIEENMLRLYDNGARHFLIINLTDLGLTPKARSAGPQTMALLTYLSRTHNSELVRMLARERNEHADLNIIEMDIMPYFDDLMVNPAKYTLKNVTDACYTGDYGHIGDEDNNVNSKSSNKALAKKIYRQKMAVKKGKFFNQFVETPKWTVCDNPNEYVYWDQLHPTSIVHSLLANYIVEKIQVSSKI